ncbi:RICIN domain-containing protein [Plantactinospora veratri]
MAGRRRRWRRGLSEGGAQRQVRRGDRWLHRAGAFLQQATCNNGSQQKFTATPTGTSGVYTVKSVLSGHCVDVDGAATADGARLLQWNCQNSTNQQWRFTLA